MNMQQVLINMHETMASHSEWLLRGNDVLD